MPKRSDVRCSYCNSPLSEEENMIVLAQGPMVCPSCGEEGCMTCMPSGRGVPCADCQCEPNEDDP